MSKHDNTVIKLIPLDETRRVGLVVDVERRGDGLGIVESRFIFYEELEKVNREELNGLLQQAFITASKQVILLGGRVIVSPMILCPGDSKPPKKEFWAVPFIAPSGETMGYKDIAVIDPATRKLVPR